jgi:PhzF family phenazine biosynthesis protein
MQFNIFFVDTFTATAFKGNPTSVCCFDTLPGAATMQDVAAELNLPVTAFISKKNGPGDYDIKYFTPVTEIPACGHATLASARIAMMQDKTGMVNFTTAQGLAINAVSKNDHILMSYPRFAWKESKVEKETFESMGIPGCRSVAYAAELESLFIELENGDMLRKVQPDYLRLKKSSDLIKEVVITSVSDDPRYDYLLRSFCPWIGIDEDPVTGSVHSVLGSFWQQRLNKNVLKAYQASQRGGELLINAFNERIEIGGQSVIVMQGQMNY